MTTQETVNLYDTIRKAITVNGAVVALYRTQGTTEKARVILPRTLHTTKTGADVVYGWDSVRGTEVSFRMDRFASAHLLPVKGVA
jgi:predicted DNA-binding transcriptional regulator YafY